MDKKDGVMKRIRATVLLVIFLLIAGGCASLSWREKVSVAASRPAPPAPSAAPAEPNGPCLEGHGFAIFNFRAVRDDYGQISVVGEIENIGFASRGVELQASLRDAGGRVIAVGHFCPAANRNIAPGESWPFAYSFGRQEDAVNAELRIVGAFRTMDILNVASTGQ